MVEVIDMNTMIGMTRVKIIVMTEIIMIKKGTMTIDTTMIKGTLR